MLRHIDEYPKTLFVEERKEGYDLVVVRLEYYTRQYPEAQCGRHRSYDPDPNFDPNAFMKKYRKAMLLSDFPPKELERFEAKLSLIRHIYETRGKNKWPRFDLDKFNENSLWFYPNGHTPDYGINTEYRINPLNIKMVASDLYIEGNDVIENAFPLDKWIKNEDFENFKNMLLAKPTSDFNAQSEPGLDALDLNSVDSRYYYTYGLKMKPITNAAKDVLNLKNYVLVGVTIKPYEEQTNHSWGDTKKSLPQIRFVYQLRDPQNAEIHFEQMFLHLKFNTVPYEASDSEIELARNELLVETAKLQQNRHNYNLYSQMVNQFLEKYTSRAGMSDLAWSSSLTGIWIFGNLTRSENNQGTLLPMRLTRAGVDLGYYSSSFDNDLFREQLPKNNKNPEVNSILDDITVKYFRDPKRNNVTALNFNRVSCAQCHQTGGRDGVHFSMNDHIDRRITTRTRPTEFLIKDLEAQLILSEENSLTSK